MPLREELEYSGKWLFRWRSYLPLALVVPIILAMRDPAYARIQEALPWWWGLFCMAVSFSGMAARVLTVAHAPEGTSGRNTKWGQIADEMNTTGMYSVVRHPIYLGNFLCWFGVSLYCGIWWLSALFVMTFWLYYERIMFAEEEFLRRKFPEIYFKWSRRTPAFMPDFRRWKPAPLPFSLKSVLRREYPGMMAIVLCFYALEVYHHVFLHGESGPEPYWTVILAAAFAVFLTLRTLKWRTRLLTVDRRTQAA